MDLNKHKEAFTNFANKMFDEMAREGGFAMPGATLGISTDDDIQLERLPSDLPETLSGFYKDLSGKLFVEVVSYSRENGNVVLERIIGETVTEVGTTTHLIDYRLFALLFVKF